MSTKAILFTLGTTGTFDGTTPFLLPTPFTQGVGGQYIMTIDSAVGLLDPQSMADFVGTKGYWVHTSSINCQSAAVRVMVAITQPQPAIGLGGNTISQPIILATTNAQAVAQEPVTDGMFVPPGWHLQFLADNGAGAPVADRCSVMLEIETLPSMSDAARAIGNQGFPVAPVAIA